MTPLSMLIGGVDEQRAIVAEIETVSTLLPTQYPTAEDRPAPKSVQPALRQYFDTLQSRLAELRLSEPSVECGVHIVYPATSDADATPAIDHVQALLKTAERAIRSSTQTAPQARSNLPQPHDLQPQHSLPKAQRKNMARAQARRRAKDHAVRELAAEQGVGPLQYIVEERREQCAREKREWAQRELEQAEQVDGSTSCRAIIAKELVKAAFPDVVEAEERLRYRPELQDMFACFLLDLTRGCATPVHYEPPPAESRSLPWGVRASGDSVRVHRFASPESASAAFLHAHKLAGFDGSPCTFRLVEAEGRLVQSAPAEMKEAVALVARRTAEHRNHGLEMTLGGLADGTLPVRQRSGRAITVEPVPFLHLQAGEAVLDLAAMRELLSFLDVASIAALLLACKGMAALAPALVPELVGLPAPGMARPAAPPSCGWTRLLRECYTTGLLSSPQRFRHDGAANFSTDGSDCVAAMSYIPLWQDFAQARTTSQAEAAESVEDVCIQFLRTPGYTGPGHGFTFANISRVLTLYTVTEGCICGLASSGFAIVLLDDGRLASVHLEDRECSVASGGQMFTAQISSSLSHLVAFALDPAERRRFGLKCVGVAHDNDPFEAFAVVPGPPADMDTCGRHAAKPGPSNRSDCGDRGCRTLRNGLHVHYLQNHRSFAHYVARGREVSAAHRAKASWKKICEQAPPGQGSFEHCVLCEPE